MSKSFLLAVMAGLALAGCGGTVAGVGEPELVQRLETAPPGARPGSCWGKSIKPAVIETVTQQILLQPSEILDDGTVARPAIYKTETRQQIVQDRKETWFETPCASDLTPEFTASVQRALKARGVYRGPITSVMDARTRAAVRAYQKPQGLESGILSLAAARLLGLVAVKDSDTS
ncbi:peptidoglycan-binding domain-containing protein [Roseovarius phycicola]|uniref:Peptidoglycan-binding domain-containing protein n=1 Tax=Roseovarius phycicola TaxID=3080976 RepID=A0ABZ2HNJ5_9RHOB